MRKWVKQYWIELLAFGAIFGVLLIGCIPDISWLNTDCDGPHYIFSAKYLYPAHKTSAPLFLLLGNLFLRIPFGTEAWRFALLSIVATMITVVFIYLIAKEKTSNKWNGIAAGLVYGSSALVISQSIIVESYALVTMFGVAAYYYFGKERYWLCSIMLGAGLATHLLGAIPIIVLMATREKFRCYEYAAVVGAFLLFYLYIPITNRPPYMWQSPNNTLISSFLADNLSTVMMLFGGLSIWDFPKRVLDALGILGVSFMLAVVPMIIAMRKWKNPLFWLFMLPVISYVTDLAPQTYVYMMPSIAAGAIIAGIELQKMKWQWTFVVIGTAIVMLGINGNYFDVGRTLDKNMSAVEFRDNELAKVSDGQILLAQQGWEWAIVFPYNMDNERNIIPICAGTLASKQYQDGLKEMGIKFDVPGKKVTLVEFQDYMTKFIIENNDNVWITVPTDSRSYRAEIVTGKGNENRMEQIPTGITDGSMDMIWKWKPSNPYDIITGAIEVDEWKYIVFSNYTVLTFTMMGVIGMVPCWIGYMFVVKRKKWSLRKAVSVRI